MDAQHAGDLSPTDAYRLLTDDPQAVLIDVRTQPEWAYVGVPDLTSVGKQLVRLEWVNFPDGARNPESVSYTHLTLPTNREV